MFDYTDFPEQRQAKIRQILSEEGKVVCTLLSRELNVSEHTIRRDLKELAQSGACKRVYGGAVIMPPEAIDFASRASIDAVQKDRIAQAVIPLIKPNSCVFFDTGTTNLAVAKQLPPGLKFTAVCNSPIIATELMQHQDVEVIFLGGRIQKEVGGAIGIDTLRQLEKMYFDQCLLGGCAFDANEGLTVFEYDDAEFKKCLVTRSSEVIVALTANKISALARYRVAGCEDITALVTDDEIAPACQDALSEKNLDLIIAR
ncbi:DeoR/GlpR transcriptional regulator [Pectobacterium aroidearum]|uniref:DeoR/GlpR transcriptional regulator n=1 Tax=Pectobacterium aroidearum TaxID=1201031 RepID=A0ABR5Z9Y7_9GAMM|nr:MULTISPECIES: DeoR/GlpR family DNA-binding transcription regulator [Pectobacterium]MBA5198590.1 DeoR/GlpR transcriptional regulator [Pectobacterium aroidearum]MBA5226906.1 DeoR/GlpR transcriptional regulator [Pectobacterium aroidearum]MBA5231382.1 DeoR/GlpR transcriptional regulator [Pectobacterium aroidearum]MBA5736528.1 DeoR/GlpR transcriptional regulator [Pectobacterium aroidearum]UXJ98602.1 DeoR/GlpR family DNA-binding transcription regulator [Pectobacterium aroidearum]